MDPDIVDLLSKIAQGGSSAALCFALYIAWQTLTRLKEGVELLRQINDHAIHIRKFQHRELNTLKRQNDDAYELTKEIGGDIITIRKSLEQHGLVSSKHS